MIDEAKVIRKAFKEKDAEIERLKARIAFMASNDYVHSLRSLLTRAADALQLLNRAANSPAISGLIVELRKAAQ